MKLTDKYDVRTVFMREGLEKRAELTAELREWVTQVSLQSKDTGDEGHSRHIPSAHERLNTNTWWAPFYKNEQALPYLLIYYPQPPPPHTHTDIHTHKETEIIT